MVLGSVFGLGRGNGHFSSVISAHNAEKHDCFLKHTSRDSKEVEKCEVATSLWSMHVCMYANSQCCKTLHA